nr:hypothetical protein [Tanacetum cinerariifolium]GFA35874.1 hypothetical protein [Tanacetum cinerariifolium]
MVVEEAKVKPSFSVLAQSFESVVSGKPSGSSSGFKAANPTGVSRHENGSELREGSTESELDTTDVTDDPILSANSRIKTRMKW